MLCDHLVQAGLFYFSWYWARRDRSLHSLVREHLFSCCCSLISNNDGPGVVRTERIVGHIHIFIPLFYFVSKITVQRHSHIPPSPSSGHNNDQWLVSNLSLAKECRTWLPIGWLWLSSAESPTQISNYCIHNYV